MALKLSEKRFLTNTCISLLLVFCMLLSLTLVSCSKSEKSGDADPLKPVELTAEEGSPANGFEWKNDYSEITITGYNGKETDLTIPAKINDKPVTKITDSAFKDFSSMTSVIVSENIKSVGENAFGNCTGLTKVIWCAAKCETAGTEENPAFNGCTALAEAEFTDKVEIIPANIFKDCKLKTVKGCKNVTEINNSAFRGCEFESFPFYDKLTTIKGAAFLDCQKLKELTIPKSMESIESGAFFGAGASLTSIKVEEGNAKYKSVDNCLIDVDKKQLILGCATSVIPSDGSVESILAAFYSARELKSIAVPEGVTSISAFSFLGCDSLETITLPKSLTSIGKNAFYGCSALKEIEIPEGVTVIEDGTFGDCQSLQKITLPKLNISYELGAGAFENCKSLTEIKISGTHGIGEECFKGCSALKKVELDNDTYWGPIRASAFENCYSLSSFTFPLLTYSVGFNAFKGTALSSVKFEFTGYWYYVSASGTMTAVPDIDIRTAHWRISDKLKDGYALYNKYHNK